MGSQGQFETRAACFQCTWAGRTDLSVFQSGPGNWWEVLRGGFDALLGSKELDLAIVRRGRHAWSDIAIVFADPG